MNLLVACPTRGRVWFETAMHLTELATDERVADLVYIHNNRSVIEARSEVMRTFLEFEYDAVIMIDDDTVPHPAVLDLASELSDEVGIAGSPTPIIRPGLPVVPNIYRIDEPTNEFAIDMSMAFDPEQGAVKTVDAIGFGAVAVSRALAQKQPDFQMRYLDDGTPYMGEDVDYCLRAKANGFSTVACMTLMADHRMEIHGSSVASLFATFLDNLNVS